MTSCWRRIRLGAAAVAVLSGERLIAQRELQAVIRGFQAGLFERAFELRLLALQKRQRVRAIGGDVRRHLAAAVDVEAYIDAAELRRIEPDVELVGARLRARGMAIGRPAIETPLPALRRKPPSRPAQLPYSSR